MKSCSKYEVHLLFIWCALKSLWDKQLSSISLWVRRFKSKSSNTIEFMKLSLRLNCSTSVLLLPYIHLSELSDWNKVREGIKKYFVSLLDKNQDCWERHNLRFANNIILMAGSKEEIKSPDGMKEKSEKLA